MTARTTKKMKIDCRTCGACCWSVVDQTNFCDLTDAEVRRFSPQFRAANVEHNSLLHVLVSQGRVPEAALRTKWRKMRSGPLKGAEVLVCCMLRGSVLRHVRCAIYETRPFVCRRAVKPGDKTCLLVRQMLQSATEPRRTA